MLNEEKVPLCICVFLLVDQNVIIWRSSKIDEKNCSARNETFIIMAVAVICTAVERDKKRTRRLGQNQTKPQQRDMLKEKREFDSDGNMV